MVFEPDRLGLSLSGCLDIQSFYSIGRVRVLAKRRLACPTDPPGFEKPGEEASAPVPRQASPRRAS